MLTLQNVPRSASEVSHAACRFATRYLGDVQANVIAIGYQLTFQPMPVTKSMRIEAS